MNLGNKLAETEAWAKELKADALEAEVSTAKKEAEAI
jgi:hypothetical protein